MRSRSRCETEAKRRSSTRTPSKIGDGHVEPPVADRLGLTKLPRAQRTRLIGCFALGVSIGGSFDGILPHEILQWHQLFKDPRNNIFNRRLRRTGVEPRGPKKVTDEMTIIGPDAVPLTISDRLNAARFNRVVLGWTPRFKPHRRWQSLLLHALLRGSQLLSKEGAACTKVDVSPRVLFWEGHQVEVRILKPTGPCNGIYLDFHGGAWVMGNARFNDRINSAIARECQIIVANVEYRLARDDRILPSIEDALAATVWTLENMRSEFGVDRAVLGGESSGAHLAACALTSLSLRQFDLSAVAGALFFYGTYDMAGTPSLRKSSGGALIMHGPSALKNLRRLTSGMDEAQRRSPRLSPLFSDLAGLPAALIVVGELDPVLDDSLLMYDKCQKANHNATLLIVPEGPHGMNRLPTRMASRINDFARKPSNRPELEMTSRGDPAAGGHMLPRGGGQAPRAFSAFPHSPPDGCRRKLSRDGDRPRPCPRSAPALYARPLPERFARFVYLVFHKGLPISMQSVQTMLPRQKRSTKSKSGACSLRYLRHRHAGRRAFQTASCSAGKPKSDANARDGCFAARLGPKAGSAMR